MSDRGRPDDATHRPEPAPPPADADTDADATNPNLPRHLGTGSTTSAGTCGTTSAGLSAGTTSRSATGDLGLDWAVGRGLGQPPAATGGYRDADPPGANTATPGRFPPVIAQPGDVHRPDEYPGSAPGYPTDPTFRPVHWDAGNHPAGLAYPGSPGGPGLRGAAVPRPVRRLGIAVQILMAITFVAGAIELLAAVGLAGLVGRIADRRSSVTAAEADRADQFQQTTALLYLLCFIGTAVVFVIWFHRLRVNAGIWAPHRQRRKPGWAIGGWFVPIVNLWFPFVIAKDILVGSRPPGSTSRSGNGYLNLWWTLWVGQIVLSVAYRLMGRDPLTIDEYVALADLGAIISVVDLLTIVAAVLMVRSLTAHQEQRLADTGLPV